MRKEIKEKQHIQIGAWNMVDFVEKMAKASKDHV